MRKIALVAAIVLTTGVLTVITKDNGLKTADKIAKVNIAFGRNLLGTAD